MRPFVIFAFSLLSAVMATFVGLLVYLFGHMISRFFYYNTGIQLTTLEFSFVIGLIIFTILEYTVIKDSKGY